MRGCKLVVGMCRSCECLEGKQAVLLLEIGRVVRFQDGNWARNKEESASRCGLRIDSTYLNSSNIRSKVSVRGPLGIVVNDLGSVRYQTCRVGSSRRRTW